MKTTATFFLLILFFSLSLSAQFTGDFTFGTDTTLDIVTWNVENFPKNGSTTVDYVSNIITELDVDILALQEIDDETSFNQVLTNTGYEGHMTTDSYKDLAFVYNPNTITNVSFEEILTNDYSFTSNPIVMTFTFGGTEYKLLNNHLKCCGDGTIDSDNTSDEEYRRYRSCNAIKTYIDTYSPNDNIIVVGDMNDELTDSYSDNVFQTLIDDPTNYKFVDMDIAEGSETYWSYPSWPSHIDHIMITNELFDEFSSSHSEIKTIRVDSYISGGFTTYDNNVTDHRPIALKLYTGSYTPTIASSVKVENKLTVYPNPAIDNVTIKFTALSGNSKIEIYNINGQKVDEISLSANQTEASWNVHNQPAGIYFAKLVTKGYTAQTKIVIAK